MLISQSSQTPGMSKKLSGKVALVTGGLRERRKGAGIFSVVTLNR